MIIDWGDHKTLRAVCRPVVQSQLARYLQLDPIKQRLVRSLGEPTSKYSSTYIHTYIVYRVVMNCDRAIYPRKPRYICFCYRHDILFHDIQKQHEITTPSLGSV